FAGAIAAFAQTQERRRQFDRLSPANVLAHGPGGILSASARSIKHLGRANGRGVDRRNHAYRDLGSPEISVRLRGMVLVFGSSRSSARHRSGWSASASRSFYLLAPHWNHRVADMAVCGFDAATAKSSDHSGFSGNVCDRDLDDPGLQANNLLARQHFALGARPGGDFQ